MDAREASQLLQCLAQAGLEVYVDGGWAGDALMGERTRPHADLDIALPHQHVPRIRELLGAQGYREQSRADSWERNFVLANPQGLEVDVHSYTLDEAGKPVHGVPYHREQLTGNGSINGYAVRCISPEWLVKFHSGYELDENDCQDVRALCRRFAIPLPEAFPKFNK